MMEIGSIRQQIASVLSDSNPRGDWVTHLRNTGPEVNQFVLFLKPEATAIAAGVNVSGVLDIVSNALSRHEVTVGGIRILNGAYLKQHEIMDAHYGVINQISRVGFTAMSIAAQAKLKESLSEKDVNILGGHQFLAKYPDSTAFDLNVLSDTVGTKKLGGGSYYIEATVGGEKVILLNPFHPHQLNHFTSPAKAILVMECLAHTSWKVLRQDLVGATNPRAAVVGSIRNSLLTKREELGFAEISQGINGVHLSAGPLEGMVELCRFFSDHPSQKMVANEYSLFGRLLLAQGVTRLRLNDFASNCKLDVNGQAVSAFDATEEMDSPAAAALLANAN
jgi:nucleoside diphosphate kinase